MEGGLGKGRGTGKGGVIMGMGMCGWEEGGRAWGLRVRWRIRILRVLGDGGRRWWLVLGLEMNNGYDDKMGLDGMGWERDRI